MKCMNLKKYRTPPQSYFSKLGITSAIVALSVALIAANVSDDGCFSYYYYSMLTECWRHVSLSTWPSPLPQAESYFDFPDKDSPYFAANVNGLIQNIQQCMNRQYYPARNATKSKIEIIFESRRQPTRMTDYIQFQTEQLRSPFFDAVYLHKLSNALQIWEFSPETAKVLRSKYGFQHVQYVPFMTTYHYPNKKRKKTSRILGLQWRSFVLYMKSIMKSLLVKMPYNTQIGTRVSHSTRTIEKDASGAQQHSIDPPPTATEDIVTQYTDNCYVQWKYESPKFRLHSISKSPCPWMNHNDGFDTCDQIQGTRLGHQSLLFSEIIWNSSMVIDVLLFGFLPCSHDNMRERICSNLERELNEFRIVCLHQVFDKDLEFFIERSKVILNIPFYQDSSLATHRIDPLLLRGKLVVSLPSSDPYLNSLYSPVVHFAKNESTLARDLRHVLLILKSPCHRKRGRTEVEECWADPLENPPENNDDDGSIYRRRSKVASSYIQDTLGDISPLCSALHQIFLNRSMEV